MSLPTGEVLKKAFLKPKFRRQGSIFKTYNILVFKLLIVCSFVKYAFLFGFCETFGLQKPRKYRMSVMLA